MVTKCLKYGYITWNEKELHLIYLYKLKPSRNKSNKLNRGMLYPPTQCACDMYNTLG